MLNVELLNVKLVVRIVSIGLQRVKKPGRKDIVGERA